MRALGDREANPGTIAPKRVRQGAISCRLLWLLAVSSLAGCSLLGPAPDETGPNGAVVGPSSGGPQGAEVASARNGTQPARILPSAPRAAIAVLRSSDSPSSMQVVGVIDQLLRRAYRLEYVTMGNYDADNPAISANPDWAAVIAIGSEAAKQAAALDLPGVFCQVFDYEPLLAQSEALFGVEAMPPLDLQLGTWKSIAGEPESVGLIVGEGNSRLVESAMRAAATAGIELHVEHAATDQEVLYRFKRLASDIDGLWLLPANDILSPRVLREVIEYAVDHDVQTIVFNESLLEWGALLSVGSDPSDVAYTVAWVLNSIIDGRASQLSRITPLGTVEVKVNERVASALGLGVLPPSGPDLQTASADEQ